MIYDRNFICLDELLVDQTAHEGNEESVLDEESKEYGYGFGWRRRGVLERLKVRKRKGVSREMPYFRMKSEN